MSGIPNLKDLVFRDTPFANLMNKRIYNVLLIATKYDAFMLEDDGRVDEQIFNELYMADTIVNITRNSCLDREFSGQYYGIPAESSAQLSAERNNYINMLTILSEKISNIMELNIAMENEILLQENSNNGC